MAKRPPFPFFPRWRNFPIFKVGRALRCRRVIDSCSIDINGGATLVFSGYRLVFTKGFARIVYERAGCWRTFGGEWRRRPRRHQLGQMKGQISIGKNFNGPAPEWDEFFDGPGIDVGDRYHSDPPISLADALDHKDGKDIDFEPLRFGGDLRMDSGGHLCVLTGDPAYSTVESIGLIDCGYPSRYDTSQFVFLGECPIATPAWISDQIIGRWLAEGRIALYRRLMDRDRPPLDREVFKAAFDVERRHAVDLVARLTAGDRRVLGSLLDTTRPPDPMILARLDILIEATIGKVLGLDVLLKPWSDQEKADAEILAMFGQESGEKSE